MFIIDRLLCFILLLTFLYSNAQSDSGSELIYESIKYHDPYGQWKSFNDTLTIKLIMADGSARKSTVGINLPEERFYLRVQRDSTESNYELSGSKCRTSITDSTAARRTPCETARLYKDYYTYLYGLPMKLKDPGTNIHDKVERKTFKGKEYLLVKVTYDKAVGSDVWQFYFDPKTYAMEVYQFFKGDPEADGKDTGEYILLSETKTVSGIKMPKVRAWYYNKDDKYLGTDILE